MESDQEGASFDTRWRVATEHGAWLKEARRHVAPICHAVKEKACAGVVCAAARPVSGQREGRSERGCRGSEDSVCVVCGWVARLVGRRCEVVMAHISPHAFTCHRARLGGHQHNRWIEQRPPILISGQPAAGLVDHPSAEDPLHPPATRTPLGHAAPSCAGISGSVCVRHTTGPQQTRRASLTRVCTQNTREPSGETGMAW